MVVGELGGCVSRWSVWSAHQDPIGRHAAHRRPECRDPVVGATRMLTYASTMKVVFATAEFASVVSAGGLGSASAGLVAELRRQGVDVIPVMPDHIGLELAGERIIDLDVPEWAAPARARIGIAAAVGEIVLVEVPGIRRPHPYLDANGEGWSDNDRRFFAFSAAVAALHRTLGADLLHLNDWHTATTLAHLEARPPTVLTVHTLGYQGATDIGWLDAFPHHRRAFEIHHSCNPLAGAIRLSDAVVAVSPTYAAEIRTPAAGCGLDGVLRDRGDAVVGILNGIDTELWDPEKDPTLAAAYSVADLSGKQQCRDALRAEMQLDPSDGPLLSVVTRLTEQKGVDIIAEVARYLEPIDCQLVVLGAGERGLVDALTAVAAEHPGRVVFHDGYDEALSHRITAGSDFFLMPSRFEPCGLAQMQAMRYGTIPIVTDVGGLHDTVVDLDAHPRRGTGFVAATPTPVAVLDAVHRATRRWSASRRLDGARRRSMGIDWSWQGPAMQYRALYDRVMESHAAR